MTVRELPEIHSNDNITEHLLSADFQPSTVLST